jgi:RimJ/RimL family protein N-acetyltransferase
VAPSVSLSHRLTEPEYRRKGLAHAALSAFLHYAVTCVLPSDPVLVALISATNMASIRLFEKLGFEQVKEPNYFDEIEMRFRGDHTVLGEPGVQVHHPEITLQDGQDV